MKFPVLCILSTLFAGSVPLMWMPSNLSKPAKIGRVYATAFGLFMSGLLAYATTLL